MLSTVLQTGQKLPDMHEAGKGIILVLVNKWDLFDKDNTSTLRYTQKICCAQGELLVFSQCINAL